MATRAVYDRGKLDGFLADQFAMVSRGQAVRAGVKESRIDYLIREGGPWQRVLPGVYATTTGTLTAEQRDMAALLHAGPKSLLTGHAAVTRHNLRCAGSNNIDVLVPKKARVTSAGFVRVVHSERMPGEWCSTDQIRFAYMPRAVADAARGICAGVRSAAEAGLKDIVGQSGLQEPLYNPRLYAPDGTLIGIPDAWWPRAGVAAEVDSLQYHLRPADYEYTVARHNRMQRAGINLLHFLPRTLKQDPGTVTEDIRQALAAGNARPRLPIKTVPATCAALAS